MRHVACATPLPFITRFSYISIFWLPQSILTDVVCETLFRIFTNYEIPPVNFEPVFTYNVILAEFVRFPFNILLGNDPKLSLGSRNQPIKLAGSKARRSSLRRRLDDWGILKRKRRRKVSVGDINNIT